MKQTSSPGSNQVSAADIPAVPRLLAHRLDDGYRRIDEAVAGGDDVAEWETFWLRLLDEYEAVCDQLEEAA